MKRTRFKQAIAASMEDAAMELAPAMDAGPLTSDDSIYAADVDEGRRYAEDAAQDVEVIDDVAESLEQLAMTLESVLQSGGLNPRDVPMVTLTINQQLGRVGLESNTLSLENYGGKMSKVEATRITLEGLGEKLEEIWKAFMAMVKRVWAAAQEFYTRIFKSASSVERYAHTLMEQASALPADASAPKYVDLGAKTASQLADGKRVPPQVFTSLGDIVNGMQKCEIQTINFVHMQLAELNRFFKDPANPQGKPFSKAVEALNGLFHPGDGLNWEANTSGDEWTKRSRVLPGNKRMVFRAEGKHLHAADKAVDTDLKESAKLMMQAISSFTVRMEDEPVGQELVHGMETLRPADIKVVLHGVLDACKWLADSQDKMQILAKQIDSNMALAGNGIIRLKGNALQPESSLHLNVHFKKKYESKDGEMLTTNSDIYRLYARTMANNARPLLTMHGYLLTLARAVAVAAHKNIAAYHKGKSVEKTDAKEDQQADAAAA